MATRRTVALVAVVFVTALVGGGAAGMLVTRYLSPASRTVVEGELPLSEELQLNPAQRERIRQIWESVREVNVKSYNEGAMLKHLEDDEILKMLNDDQKSHFARIHQQYQERFTATDAKRQAAFQDAVAKTKELLNDRQRRRYDEILARRLGTDQPAATQPAAGSSASANFFSFGRFLASPG